MREAFKLPQARRYLRAATWGFENLKSQMLIGTGAIFHVVGILAFLRAVQHALLNHDRNLSPKHQEVISAWEAETKDTRSIPALHFIITSRNLALKEAAFPGYAIHSESGVGEGTNREVAREDYELVHYVGGERHNLETNIQSAIDWCEGELTKIEARLPARYEEDADEDEWDFSNVLPDSDPEEG